MRLTGKSTSVLSNVILKGRNMAMQTLLYTAALLGAAALAMAQGQEPTTPGQTPVAEGAPQSPPVGDFRVSLSVSPFTEEMIRQGTVFTNGKITAQTPEALQRLFMASGANEVYARIST